MAERRSKSELAAAVLAACSTPMSEREIRGAISTPGASAPPSVEGIIAALMAAGDLRRAGVRHTLEGGGETLFVTNPPRPRGRVYDYAQTVIEPAQNS